MQTSKNNYEFQKQERERARLEKYKRMSAKTNSSKIWYVVGIIFLLVIGYWIYSSTATTASNDNGAPDLSISYAVLGRDHIEEGASHPPYNSNPPSSGWHYEEDARGGFYEEQLPDEQLVHNLEHGDIWIAYRPDISDDLKEVLESFAGPYVVVSPREANEGDISLVAWGRVDTFDVENEVDEDRIWGFIERYDNNGPEKVRT